MQDRDTIEKRALARPVETRATNDTTTAAGYAAVFNEPTLIAGSFLETIAPGAFRNSIAADDIRAFFDHDPGRVLGRKSAGTLRVSEDQHGLKVEIDLPQTSDGNDAKVLIARGDVTGMSFAAIVVREQWDETGNIPKRTILEARLVEVSPVSLPAYDVTTIALRALERARKAEPPKPKTAGLSRHIALRELAART